MNPMVPRREQAVLPPAPGPRCTMNLSHVGGKEMSGDTACSLPPVRVPLCPEPASLLGTGCVPPPGPASTRSATHAAQWDRQEAKRAL